MGMDLKPIEPSDDAPSNERGIVYGRYNWKGWDALINYLNKWELDTSEFLSYNDGDVISDETCKEVANAIEANLHTLSQEDKEWLQPHIILWRTCGGYEQW